MGITSDEDVLHGQPRLEGTRVGVLHVYDMVVEAGSDPASVADALDVSLGAVYEALAYFYNNPDEMRRRRRDQGDARDALRERALDPPVEADGAR